MSQTYRPPRSVTRIDLLSLCNSNSSKAIPSTGREGLYGSEILRIPHCLDSRLTDGGKVSPTHRPRSTPLKQFSASGTHFC
jgi:hypothetical protein